MKSVRCPEKQDLVTAYQLAMRKYSDAVPSLDQNMGICARVRYDALRSLVEDARQFAHEAQERLDKHVAHHFC